MSLKSLGLGSLNTLHRLVHVHWLNEFSSHRGKTVTAFLVLLAPGMLSYLKYCPIETQLHIIQHKKETLSPECTKGPFWNLCPHGSVDPCIFVGMEVWIHASVCCIPTRSFPCYISPENKQVGLRLLPFRRCSSPWQMKILLFHQMAFSPTTTNCKAIGISFLSFLCSAALNSFLTASV